MVDAHRSVDGTLLLALDGTEHFSSPAIHGERCATRRHANGQVTYCHSALTPVLVKPGGDNVIALAPEFVTPQDGAAKQDGELTAAQRWLAAHGAAVARLKTTVLGDDRYCHEPFCRLLLDAGLAFILVGKPDSHATTDEGLEHFGRNGAVRTVSRTRWTGRRRATDSYRYAHASPWRDADDALEVNGCALVTTDDSSKVWYRNACATSLALDDGNGAEVVAAGRRRGKIENENNNTLKTQGYHCAHNCGHGQQHLASLPASLIILAFLTHTVLAWRDDNYRLLRQKRSSRQRLFNDIRTLTSYRCFETWEALMDFMLNSFESPPPEPTSG